MKTSSRPWSESEVKCYHTKIENESDIEEKITLMFSRDFDDSHDVTPQPSIEDKKWEIKARSSLKQRSDNHFQVDLPFRDDQVVFPSNQTQVLKWLQGTKQKLIKDKKYYEDYAEFMSTLLQHCFAEKIPANEVTTSQVRVWYLVHHGIRHKQKKTLRVVFDSSLECMGVFLNGNLLQGPDLTNNLLGVLLRFRQGTIAITGDIEKMFLQIKVSKRDSDCMRFFWYPNGNVHEEPAEYRLTVHVFGPVSSPSCANYVLRHNVYINPEYISPDAKETINRSFYVDDLIKSVDSEKHAIALLKEIEKVVAKGGINLTAFVSNSRRVLSALPSHKLAKVLKQ